MFDSFPPQNSNQGRVKVEKQSHFAWPFILLLKEICLDTVSKINVWLLIF